MFKEKFIELCNEKGVSPSKVCRDVGITPTAYSCWTEASIPRKTTLKRIADYFGVTPEYFTQETEPQEPQSEQTELLEAMRRKPSMRVLFSLAKDATEEEINTAIKIIVALKK